MCATIIRKLRILLLQEAQDVPPKLGWRRPMDPTVGDERRGADLHAHLFACCGGDDMDISRFGLFRLANSSSGQQGG